MNIDGWDHRYRSAERAAEDLKAAPTPLVQKAARAVPAGVALDLACGTGRNALWLAEQGWSVTAVDGSETAIRILKQRAAAGDLTIKGVVADLENDGFVIKPASWDLVVVAFYLQRTLFEPLKAGVKPGGTAVVIVHTTEGEEEPTAHRLRPGELRGYFAGWKIVSYYEGPPTDGAHRRSSAEIVARKPV